jgi:Ca2+-binding RTX toxin-like protein
MKLYSKNAIASLFARKSQSVRSKNKGSTKCPPAILEPLEPRILLSADNAIAGVTGALATGFDAIYSELDDLLENDPSFDANVPGILISETTGDSTVALSPTLRQALGIKVDIASGTYESGFGENTTTGTSTSGPSSGYSNSFGGRYSFIINEVAPAEGFLPANAGDEYALDAMDIDGDGIVKVNEAFSVLVMGEIELITSYDVIDWDTDSDIDSNDFRAQLDYLLPFVGVPTFLQDRFDMSFSATSASPGSDVLFDLDVSLTLKQNDQVDLGTEADALHIAFESANVPVNRTIDFGSFVFGFNGASDESVTSDDFYFAAPEGNGVRFAVDIGTPGSPVSLDGKAVNVGFLGTTVQNVSGDGYMLDMDVFGFADDPSNPDALGFTTQPTTGSGTITAASEPESITDNTTTSDDYKLFNDIIFTLKMGTQSYSPTTEITVDAWSPLLDVTIGELAGHVEGDIDDALGDAGLITVDHVSGKLRLNLPSVNPEQLGFGSEVSGSLSIEAADVSPQLNRFALSTGAVQTYSFLLSVGGAVPKLVTVNFEPETFIDLPDPALDFYLLTKTDLIDQIQAGLDAAFGAGVVTVSDTDADNKISLSTTGTLEITQTLTLDTVEEITLAELADNPQVFDVEPDSNANFTVDLTLKADAGLLETGTSSDYRPEGTISVDIDPFDQGLLTDGHDLEVVSYMGDPDTGTPIPRTRYELTFGGDMDPEADPSMLYFNLVTPENMIGLLQSLGLALQDLGTSATFANYDIPFADASFADLFDFRGLIDTSLLFDDGGDGFDGATDYNKLLEKYTYEDTTYLLPTFDTAQDLADRLSEILNVALTGTAGINAEYNTATDELTYNVVLLSNDRISAGVEIPLTVPFEFDVDLSPFAKLSVDETGAPGTADVSLEGRTVLNTTFGIDLTPPGKVIYNNTLLTHLNGGDGIKIIDVPAVTGTEHVRTVYGLRNLKDNTLNARGFNVNDAHFGLRFDFTSDVFHVTVDADETANNLSLTDLVSDIQSAIDEALSGTGFAGDLVAGNDAYGRLTLDRVSTGSIEIFTDAADPIVTELGFKTPVQVGNTVTAQKSAPVLIGRLTGNASFDIAVGSDPAQTVIITAAATAENVTIADLVADVNNALIEAGLGDDIIADFDNSTAHGIRLLFSAKNPGTEFTIDNINFFAESQLGLNFTSLPVATDKTDFVIIDRAGGIHNIVLDPTSLERTDASYDPLDGLPDDPTVDDLIALINAQTGGAVIADINNTHNGLRLIDDTSGTGQLRVETINGSGVALQLGLIGIGSSADETILEGGFIGLTTLDNRFFVENAEIAQSLILETPDAGVYGDGLFGLIGVDVNFDGSLSTELSAELRDPNVHGDSGIGGQATLAELFAGINVVDTPTVSKLNKLDYDNQYDIPGFGDFRVGSVLIGASGATAVVIGVEDFFDSGTLTLFQIDGTFQDNELIGQVFPGPEYAAAFANGTVTPNDNFGEFILDVTVQEGFNEYGFGADLKALNGLNFAVPVSLTTFGNPYDPVEPVASLVASAYAALTPFELFDYSHLYSALEGLQGVLEDVEAGFGLLNQEIPGISKSVSDLLSLVDGFTRGVDNIDDVFDVAALALADVVDMPALRLQDIPGALRGAFGLPDNVDPEGVDTDGLPNVDWVRLDFDEADNMLLVDMSLHETISTKLGFDIDLSSQSLPNLTSGGVLIVEGSLDVNLNFGIDLATPTNAYLYNTSTISGSLHLIGEGQEYAGGEDGMGLVFRSIGPLAVFIQDGEALVDVAFSLPGLKFGDSGKLINDVVYADWQDPATSADEVEIHLPMYYGGEGPNDYVGEFSASGSLDGGLSVTVPDFSEIQADITSGAIEYDPFDNILLAFDDLNFYLESLSDMVAEDVLGLNLPFIGDQMADILFIETFRNTLFRTLKNEVENAINPDPDTFVQDVLLNGNTGLGITGLFATGGLLEGYLKPGTFSYFDNVSDSVPLTNWYREWSFTLTKSKTYRFEDFELGIANLGFDVDIPVDVNLTWEFDLCFGVNLSEGAYIDVSDSNELLLDLEITLPEDGIGTLGYLKVNVTDPGNDTGAKVNFEVDVKKDNTSDAHLGFSDLGSINPVATILGSPLDGYTDAATLHLMTTAIKGLPSLSTDLVIDWSLSSTNVSDPDYPARRVSELNGDAVIPGIELIAFNNMELDAKTVAQSLLGPLFEDINSFIQPFMPIVDSLTYPIPILSDLSGEPFTLLDLAEIFGNVDADFIEAVADILDVIDTIGNLGTLPVLPLGNLVLYQYDPGTDTVVIDHFIPNDPNSNLADVDVLLDDLGGQADPYYPADTSTTNGWTFNGQPYDITATDGFKAKIDSNGFLTDAWNGDLADGLRVPIFTDPRQGVKLLLDQDAVMIDYGLPPLGVDFGYLQVFPVWGPLAVSIEISFAFTVDLHSVGFDTNGYHRYGDGGFLNSNLIFDGFYLNDLDEDGVDAPEVMFEFGLVGAAELNIGIARAGVGGGIDARIFLDWYDAVPDGRVHLSEMLGSMWANNDNPLAVFDAGGGMFFQMFAFLEISLLGIDEEFPITPETELFSFDIPFERPPVLATQTGNTLILNMGPYAEDRLNGDTSDGHEHIVVNTSGSTVQVTSPTFGVTTAQEFSGINHIVGIGGQGNDTIELNLGTSGITYDLEGNVGDDTITVTGGAGGTIRGGEGNDTLSGGAGDDIIYGEQGYDTINGGDGYDILFGDEGRYFASITNPDPLVTSRVRTTDGADIINGGADDDIIIGAGGDDILNGNGGNDVIIGDGGRFAYLNDSGGHFDIITVQPSSSIYPYVPEAINTTYPTDPDAISKDIDKIYDALMSTFSGTDLGFGGNDTITGGEGGDIILGGSADDVINGNDGADIILGGKGFDDIHGNGGADTIFGNDQADTISGDAGADVISGGSGNDYIHGNTGADVMKGDSGADVMFGDAGNDQVFGQTEPDILFGGIDDDLVVGGSSNDIMFGDDGVVAKLDTAYDPDTDLDSAIAYKVIYNDTLITSTDVDDLLADVQDQEGDSWWDDEIRSLDLIHTYVVSGDGDDFLSGNAGDDFMFGGGGNDTMGGDVDPRLPTAGSPTEISEDVMIGDGGMITFTGRRFRSIETVITPVIGTEFDDTIYGDNGDDYIFGGWGSDYLFGGHGKVVDISQGAQGVGAYRGPTDTGASDNDIIFGDNGQILFAPYSSQHPENFGVLTQAQTTDTSEDTGADDYAEGELGEDIIFGGVNNDDSSGPEEVDRLFGSESRDVVLGDNGIVSFDLDPDQNLSTLDQIRSFLDHLGGTDEVSGSQDFDVLIGGTGGDRMYGDDVSASHTIADGKDIMLGDNGQIDLLDAMDPVSSVGTGSDLFVFFGGAVVTVNTTDGDPDFGATLNDATTGGVDYMYGNYDDDIIAGSAYGDFLYGSEGDDLILGDAARFEWLYDGSEVSLFEKGQNTLLETFDSTFNTLDLVTTKQPTFGGRDTIDGEQNEDVAFGGTDVDIIHGGADDDILFGDHGHYYPQHSVLAEFASRNFFAIDMADDDGGDGDKMFGDAGDDSMFGQQGDDRMWGNEGDDDMTGGHNVPGGIDEITTGQIEATLNPAVNDLMDGGAGDDAMAGDNAIIWRRGDELTPDDLSPRFRQLTADSIYTTTADSIATNISGAWQSDPADADGRDITLIDHSNTIQAIATDPRPFGADVMAGGADSDVMFGELANDLMQGDGNIGDDDGDPDFITHQITVTDSGTNPDTDETLYFNIPEQATDADDYMEGNGGSDLMYGGLGQDDMIGGSSALFGLDDAHATLLGINAEELRPDSSDVIFGGAGAPARLVRNDFVGYSDTDVGTDEGVGAVPTGDDPSIALVDRHSRDADFIMGDNANVYRLVVGGALGTDPNDPNDLFLTFNYDNYTYDSNSQTFGLRILPRAMEQLDYTLGGSDYAGGSYNADGQAIPPGEPADNGAADLIHGESGDDIIFGMTGSDVMFGESDDDDIIGGYGNDWISGGTGQDGVIGDDGLILTSRNSEEGEPLNGIEGLLAHDASTKYNNGNALDEIISTPGGVQYAVINVTGELKKTADLVPFSYDPNWMAMDDEFPPEDTDPAIPFADDIIFGGLDSDWLHGGSGDDAISGAEALEEAYVPTFDGEGNPNGVLDLGYNAFDLPNDPANPGDTITNPNPGNVLMFNPMDLNGQHLNNRFRAGEFFLYDEYDPRRMILLDPDTGELYKSDDGGGVDFLLNFNEAEGVFRKGGDTNPTKPSQNIHYDAVNDDGADAIFGDLGNDWLVGGTGRDNIYGGWGNDLLNADDVLDINDNSTKQNTPSDTHPTYEDRAYGGAGRDVLIGNTGGDRLIDWVGEYNSYLVPYAPFGQASVSRTLMPHLQEFLYALSAGDGADPTRYSDAIGGDEPEPTNNNPIPSRNGEPYGELGLVLQKDFAWQAQTGAPADPQAGNIPGGKRDVLRSAAMNSDTPEAEGFFADSGVFEMKNGALYVSAESIGGDAVAVYYVDEVLPSYYEILATVQSNKPIGGWKANAYVIFDYQGQDDFKFAGINVSNDKIEMGYRDANGWHVVEQTPYQLKPNDRINLLLAVNGTTVTLRVDGSEYFTHVFAARIIDGYEFGLNTGMVGIGSDNARGIFDNVIVQKLPPKETFRIVDEFGGGDSSIIQSVSGSWNLVNKGLMSVDPGTDFGIALLPLSVSPASFVEYSTTVKPDGLAGFVFDYYSETDFKFAGVNSSDGTVQVGHYKNGIWTIDASADKSIRDGKTYEIGVAVVGTKVSLNLDGQTVINHTYNALLNDGAQGLLVKDGTSLFDLLTIWGDDQDYKIFDYTAAEAGALGFDISKIAGLYDPTFTITWIVDDSEE